MLLNKDQEEAFNVMSKGNSTFLTGSAGTGKSFLLQKFYEFCVNKHTEKCVSKTSSSGISAILIGGRTLHSWSGIFLGEGTVNEIISKMPFMAKQTWKRTKVLFIDEISMIHPDLFDKLENIARILRRTNLPFGGIQLICSGDFFQLGPVCKDNIEKFCFEAKSWKSVIKNTINLTTIIRQKDKVFQDLLNEARFGTINKENIELLNSRIDYDLTNDLGIEPTMLFSKNVDVNYINFQKLEELKEEKNTFRSRV